MPLDSLFGPVLGPLMRPFGTDVEPWERQYSPASMVVLTPSTALMLKRHMESIANGFAAGKVLTNDTCFLWLANKNGEILVALEELVVNSQPTGHVKFKQLLARLDKLGHPSLVNCEEARIGGEIFYDVRSSRWIINNKSARYSRHPSRMPWHLDNVATEFAAHGIVLDISWL